MKHIPVSLTEEFVMKEGEGLVGGAK